MDGATGTYGQDYNAANPGVGRPTGTATGGQPESNFGAGGPGAAPVQEKRSLTDKVKGLLGGNKHHPNDGTAATDQTTAAGTETTAAQPQGVYGDAAGANDTDGTGGSKVGCFDKIKGKVGMGHAARATGYGADHNPEGAYGTNATGPGAGGATRSETSPYGSTGVGPTSGAGYTNTGDYAASGPTEPGYRHRSENSPYGATGVGPTSGTAQPGSGPPGSAGNYGQGQDVRTESPYDAAGANPETWNPEDHAGTGYNGEGGRGGGRPTPGSEYTGVTPPAGQGYGNNRQTNTDTGYTGAAGGAPGNGYTTGGGAPTGAAGYDKDYNQQTGTGDAGNDNNYNHQTGTGGAGYDNNYNRQTGTGGAGAAGYGGDGNQQNTGGLPGGWPQPAAPGGATHQQGFTDPQGNAQESPYNHDNVKKEGFVSKIMDKIHSPRTKTSHPTDTNAPAANAPY